MRTLRFADRLLFLRTLHHGPSDARFLPTVRRSTAFKGPHDEITRDSAESLRRAVNRFAAPSLKIVRPRIAASCPFIHHSLTARPAFPSARFPVFGAVELSQVSPPATLFPASAWTHWLRRVRRRRRLNIPRTMPTIAEKRHGNRCEISRDFNGVRGIQSAPSASRLNKPESAPQTFAPSPPCPRMIPLRLRRLARAHRLRDRVRAGRVRRRFSRRNSRSAGCRPLLSLP